MQASSRQIDTHSRTRASLAMFVLAAVIGASPAMAQNALGDGRALDRNLRVGSGGRNPTKANTIANTARFNNAVVTGNAGSGKSFRGYVGYLSTDDFRASLGSNDIYSFQRDSAAGTNVARGIRGTDALRYQFGLITGQRPPSILGGAAAATGAGTVLPRSGSSAEPGLSQSSALRSTSDYLTERSLSPTIIGYHTRKDGSRYALSASPLLGVTMSPIDTPKSPTVETPTLPGIPSTIPGTTPNQPASTPTNTSTNAEKNAKARRTNFRGLEASRPGVPNPFTASLLVDQASASSKVDTRVRAPSPVIDSLVNQLPPEKKTAGAPTSEEPAPKAPWEQELERLSERLKSGGERGDPNAPNWDRKSPDGKSPAEPERKPGTMSIEEIRKLVKPDLEKIDADVARALAAARPLLSKLSPDKPTDNAAYNEHLAAGEKLLGESRYFDAEDRFLRALAAKPGDPMAGFGRVHAQLGAGLYLSAAMNLHTIFQDHPEMIGTRYARTLLPTDRRAGQITDQMRESIRATRTLLGRDAALLLAYLGYQRSDRAMLEEGVTAFAERTNPDDTADRTLLALMQRVWVDGAEPAPPSPTPSPTPPANPPATPVPATPVPANPPVPTPEKDPTK